jgi:hypothetical protein
MCRRALVGDGGGAFGANNRAPRGEVLALWREKTGIGSIRTLFGTTSPPSLSAGRFARVAIAAVATVFVGDL